MVERAGRRACEGDAGRGRHRVTRISGLGVIVTHQVVRVFPTMMPPGIKIIVSNSREKRTLMNARIHITIVDDDPHTLYFIEHALTRAFPEGEIVKFTDGMDALHFLEGADTDL